MQSICRVLKRFARRADGVRTNRLLLDTSDHVSGLVKKCADLLRAAVTTAHANLKNTHDQQMALLIKSDVWSKLATDQQASVLGSNGITDVSPIKVGTDDELLRTLDSNSVVFVGRQVRCPAWSILGSISSSRQIARAQVAASATFKQRH